MTAHICMYMYVRACVCLSMNRYRYRYTHTHIYYQLKNNLYALTTNIIPTKIEMLLTRVKIALIVKIKTTVLLIHQTTGAYLNCITLKELENLKSG